MKVLLTGAGGQLGREVAAAAPAGAELLPLARAELDVTDAAAVADRLARERPAVVVNAAAYTAVDRAESERDRAFAVNAAAPESLARAAAGAGARLLHVSTDYVFDGAKASPYTPDDPPAPLSVYGASKLEGERRALAAAPATTLVVRSSWLYSRHGRNFVTGMLGRMRAGEALRVVGDQVGSPTWAAGLAAALWRAAARPDLAGVRHWADGGATSWHELAVAIQEEALAAGLLARPVPIAAIVTADYPTPARRPPYSALESAATARELGLPVRPWRRALSAMIRDLAARGAAA